jgi:hypothetical protein
MADFGRVPARLPIISVMAMLAACSRSSTPGKARPPTDEEILALKPPGTNAVIVKASGPGTVVISIAHPSASCVAFESEPSNHGQICWAYLPLTTTSVLISATPGPGSRLTGWGPPECAGSTGFTCEVEMSTDRIFIVRVEPAIAPPRATFTLKVHILGSVDGAVTAFPDVGLACGPTGRASLPTACYAAVPNTQPPTQVTLAAVATVPGTELSGWGGSCSGTGLCVVAMDRDRGVTVEFKQTTGFPPTTGLTWDVGTWDGTSWQ